MIDHHTSMQSNVDTFHRLVESIFRLLRTRFQLISIELAEEKKRLIVFIFLGFITVISAIMTLIVLTALVVIIFWNTYRLQALAALGALYALACIISILKVWINIRNSPIILQSTLNELEKDHELFCTKS
ncbi:MAG: phage holin family protein [Burkholderia sp.]|nr:phage holin family protein [Burkholderia sp.]